jgi:hypothetical protein
MGKKDYTVTIQSTCPVSLTFSDGDVGRYDKMLAELAGTLGYLSKRVQVCSQPYDRAILATKRIYKLSLNNASAVTAQNRNSTLNTTLINLSMVRDLETSYKMGTNEVSQSHSMCEKEANKFKDSQLHGVAHYLLQLARDLDYKHHHTREEMHRLANISAGIVYNMGQKVSSGYGAVNQQTLSFDQEFHKQIQNSFIVTNAQAQINELETTARNIMKVANDLLWRMQDVKGQMAGKIQA